MKIPGPIPAGGASHRVAQAYGVAKKPTATSAPSAPTESAGVAGAAGGAGALRSILTDEERAYFDQLAMLGPISYGPGRRAAAPAEMPRGLRLDVTG
jgi:hypothetical protein